MTFIRPAPEHPQPAVQSEHPAADRPRPAGRLHAGRRHLGQVTTGSRQPAHQRHDQPVPGDLRPADPDQHLHPRPGARRSWARPARSPARRPSLHRGRPVDPRRDLGRPRHARLDADRPNSGGTLKIQDLTVSLSIAFPIGFRPHRGPDRARRDARSRCSRAWAAAARTSSTPSSTTRRRPPSPRAPPRSPGPSGPPTLGSATLTSLAARSADGTWTLQLTNTQTGATGTLDTWSLNITPAITVTPVDRQTTVNGVERCHHVHDRLPAAAAQRHLHDPARPRHPGPVRRRAWTPTRTRASTCSAAWARTARRPPSSTPPPTCPRRSRRPPTDTTGRPSRVELLEHRRARQLHHPGGHDGGRRQRHAGPAQPDLPQRPRPDGDAVSLRPQRRRSWARSILFSGVGSGTAHGQLHQHGLRRQRGHADPGGQRAVLRHLSTRSSPWPPSSPRRRA